MTPFVCIFLVGFATGLRALVALAALTLTCYSGRLNLAGTPLAFLGSRIITWIAVALGLFEVVNDKRSKTPSRLIPAQFGARIAIGILVGYAFGLAQHNVLPSVLVAVLGAVTGTLIGARLRAWLAARLGRDLFAALIEDVLCIAVLAFALS